MDYRLDTLSNGLRIITSELPNSESATVTVWVAVGSRFESAKTSGLSHFLEHMVFKGSKKRPSTLEISQAVDAIGAEFNAATSKDWTNFYIKSRVGKVETAFDVLSDMVINPILDAKEIEKDEFFSPTILFTSSTVPCANMRPWSMMARRLHSSSISSK